VPLALLAILVAAAALAVVVAPRVLPDLVESHPVGARAVFLGDDAR